MALQEKHRNTVYNAFVPLLGEEVTEAVLSHLPARDVEESVTREHLDRRFAEQGAYIDRRFAEQGADIDRRFAEVRSEFDRKLDEVRTEIVDLRLDMTRQITEVRVDVAQQIAVQADKTFHRMLTIAGLGLGIATAIMTILFAAFT
jgi:Fe2+ transport system protein B